MAHPSGPVSEYVNKQARRTENERIALTNQQFE